LTICEGAEEDGISKTTCHEILTENLGIHHVAAKFMPHHLSEDRKQNHRVHVSKELVDLVSKEHVDLAYADENFLKNIVSGDDTWVYGCDIKTKVRSSHWVLKSPPGLKKCGKFSPV
jgi:hypothetical protein